ncbi:MAG: hypothetical protein R3C44_19620 [Chloroflexota bacterium]
MKTYGGFDPNCWPWPQCDPYWWPFGENAGGNPMMDEVSVNGLAAEDVVAAAAEHHGYAGYYPSGFFLTIASAR